MQDLSKVLFSCEDLADGPLAQRLYEFAMRHLRQV